MKKRKAIWWTILGIGVLLAAVYAWQTHKPANPFAGGTADVELLRLSEDLLAGVKDGTDTHTTEAALAALPPQRILKGLPNDAAKKTFWINVYNAVFQLLATREKLDHPDIFTRQQAVIAGRPMSLDDMEHHVLRSYTWKYSMGYLKAAWVSPILRQWAVDTLDYRIHFALNCGAKSCPPIFTYQPSKLDQQLELATSSFLQSETKIDANNRTVTTSKIMDWYRGDFGGSRGVMQLLERYTATPITGYTLRFSPYNWEKQLHYFSP